MKTPASGLCLLADATAVLMHCGDSGVPLPMKSHIEIVRAMRPSLLWFNLAKRDGSRREAARVLSRHAVQTAVTTMEECAAGTAVIIKSDLNYGRVAAKRGDTMREEHSRILAEVTARCYPIMLARDVPKDVWSDERFIVERYLTNEAGRFWRAYVVFGKVIACVGASQDTLKELCGSTFVDAYVPGDSEPFCSDPHVASAVARQALTAAAAVALDYGAIDFVEDSCQEVYCVDINPCPHFVEWGVRRRERLLALIRREANRALG